MEEPRMEGMDEEYLDGLEGRKTWPVAEDIFQRPILEIKRRPWLALDGGETIAAAARQMVEMKIGSVLVTHDGYLTGILTERDLFNKMVLEPFEPAETTLADLMTAEPTTVTHDDTVCVAIHRMSQGGHRHIPIVNRERRPVGLVSVRDIVDYLSVIFPHQILTVPPNPEKIPETREGG